MPHLSGHTAHATLDVEAHHVITASQTYAGERVKLFVLAHAERPLTGQDGLVTSRSA
jgi:hypothetical protein